MQDSPVHQLRSRYTVVMREQPTRLRSVGRKYSQPVILPSIE